MTNNSYLQLNAQVNLWDSEGKIQFDKDKDAVRAYFLEHVNQSMVFFHSLDEKIKYLVENGYYESAFLDQYPFEFIKEMYKEAYSHQFRFRTFVSAYKFYRQYALKTFDGERYLERYEDRVVANALYLARGDQDFARQLLDEIITGRFQPATPTFLNAGRAQRGNLISCFLLEVEDSMEGIARAQTNALQLSKRGGGVSFNLTNLRAANDPIKGMVGQSSGVLPVMKILEDCFKYSNQLGQRDGSGAVYLNIFHKDIETFLDSRRENADDAIRINKLSLGVVVPDIFFELCKNDEEMYLFSPYDVAKKYGKPFSEIYITDKYRELVDDSDISKKKIKARHMLTRIAETLVESGYPYLMFEDTVNRESMLDGKIKFSNLCSEILQVSTESKMNDDLSYKEIGKDISCNLGSINIAKIMEGSDFGSTISTAIRALSAVSDLADEDMSCSPTIQSGNALSRAIGLGAMNLHGYLATQGIEYGSEDALQFVDAYFRTVKYHALAASMNLARTTNKRFDGFSQSKYALGTALTEYIENAPVYSEKVRGLVDGFIPSVDDWKNLSNLIQINGLYNSNLQAVAPTGSISYVNDSTPSLMPVTAPVETRKEGMMGQVYYPAYGLTDENLHLYKDLYQVGWKAVIDTYAAGQRHVDQGMSCTVGFGQDATTREINKAQIYAWRKGLKTMYYTRLKMNVLGGDPTECVSCAV